MASPLYTSLVQTLESLRNELIVTGKEYDKYTRVDHNMALAFRIIASAHVENYVEQRCLQVARAAAQRWRQGHPSRCAKALIGWLVVTSGGKWGPMPLDESEYPRDSIVETALLSFSDAVERSHGISGPKLSIFLFRLGVRDSDIDSRLVDSLTTLASARGVAAHRPVNRAKTMTEPVVEWASIEAIRPMLEELDAKLGVLD